ncbi:MAG: symmetrical bis(5'-nucleosyl)-tetraphosphatase [Gammaproteobacteria bacterium]
MATYAIGDVQGCYDELSRLLEKIRFDPAADRLWFTGDLVNRGPRSRKVLKLVRGLGRRAVTVLGNHDLHLVAAHARGKVRSKDTFRDVLEAGDAGELVAWLRRRPLLHVEGGWAMVHAGLAPQWSLAKARAVCAAASGLIASERSDEFFRNQMYGNEPDAWSEQLRGWDRLRFVINCCTRLRVCTPQGRMQLDYTGPARSAPAGTRPWFALPGRRSRGCTLLFGHWSTLGHVHWPRHRVYGLDTGCVWGRSLTALRLDDRRRFAVKSAFHGSD